MLRKCTVRYDARVNATEQTEHLNGLCWVCASTWTRSCSECKHTSPQCSHWKGESVAWERMCALRWLEVVKLALHAWHWNGWPPSPACTWEVCRSKESWAENDDGHCSHLNSVSSPLQCRLPDSSPSITSPRSFLLTGLLSWWIRLCLLSWDAVWKLSPHIWHLNFCCVTFLPLLQRFCLRVLLPAPAPSTFRSCFCGPCRQEAAWKALCLFKALAVVNVLLHTLQELVESVDLAHMCCWSSCSSVKVSWHRWHASGLSWLVVSCERSGWSGWEDCTVPSWPCWVSSFPTGRPWLLVWNRSISQC